MEGVETQGLNIGQAAGHCYSGPPPGPQAPFLLCHNAIRERETKDDNWRLVGHNQDDSQNQSLITIPGVAGECLQ